MATYDYPRPALTVDGVVFGLDLQQSGLMVMLVQRGEPPFEGAWGLPGGFVRMDETLDGAAMRELSEETGLRDIYLEQLYTFGEVDRDPRGRVVTVAYFALVKLSDHVVQAATDATDAAWFDVTNLPPLAFDHDRILETALTRLRGKVRYQPIGFELLPGQFTLGQLQRMYEIILGRELDKRNFRRKVQRLGVLKELDEFERGVARRAARLYEFDKPAYDRLVTQGLLFEI